LENAVKSGAWKKTREFFSPLIIEETRKEPLPKRPAFVPYCLAHGAGARRHKFITVTASSVTARNFISRAGLDLRFSSPRRSTWGDPAQE
jgi:hypothetical protein